MPERLTPREGSLLTADPQRLVGAVGTIVVLDPGAAPLGYDGLLDLVRDRLPYVPRYRQRVRSVPARLAAPVWVDAAGFDLLHHVRRAVLPAPGSPAQLAEFSARVLARPLDRSRPLWELYLVEGLQGGGEALVAKTHPALVDNLDTVDLLQVLLDGDPQPVPDGPAADSWQPLPEPTAGDLLRGAVWEGAQDPQVAADNLRASLVDTLGLAAAATELALGSPDLRPWTESLGIRTAAASPELNPLRGPVSTDRRLRTLRLPLAELQAIRAAHGATIHDVVLTLVAGALRDWLLSRGESVVAGRPLTALAPVAVPETGGALTALGHQVEARLVGLPIEVVDPVLRLGQLSADRTRVYDPERSVPASELSGIAGFAPATEHLLGIRALEDVGAAAYDVVVLDVPGPRNPVFAGEVAVRACYPVVPLTAGHRLSIGLTSYCGELFVGLLADRATMDDLDVIAQSLADGLDQLRAAGSA